MGSGCFRPSAPPGNLDQEWGEQKTFDYHGVKINYCEAGQGPPIILLHGFGACAYSWRYLIPPLAAQRADIGLLQAVFSPEGHAQELFAAALPELDGNRHQLPTDMVGSAHQAFAAAGVRPPPAVTPLGPLPEPGPDGSGA
jgi:hypothetical protein